MAIKMIAFDLDGTALDTASSFSGEMQRAISEADRRGIKVVAATGRPVCSLPSEIREVKGLRYAITANGARTIDLVDDNVLFENEIEREAVLKICEIEEQEGGFLEFFSKGEAFIGQFEYDLIAKGGMPGRSREYVMRTRRPVPDIFEYLRKQSACVEDIVVFYRDPEHKKRVEERLLGEVAGITITMTEVLNHEIGGRGTSKAAALAWMLAHFGFERSELMALGDSPNDIEMIRFAGLGIAMGNAYPEVKEAADRVTVSNAEDGAALAIWEYALR